MPNITVIGSFVMDMVAEMNEFPKPGQTIIGNNVNYYPGGKGANQCVTIVRLGEAVEMCGMLGNDGNGQKFLSILKSEGIKCDNVFICDKPTSVAQIQIDQKGENRICVIPSANHEFGVAELNKIDSIIQNTKWLLLQLELRIDVTEEIINRAYQKGVKIILNPAPAANLSRETLSKIDYLTPNETELSFLTNTSVDKEEEIMLANEKLYNMGVKHVVTTIGSKGAIIYDEKGGRKIGSYKVKAIDTVAAGDSFNGALAVCLSQGKSIDEAVKYANAVGALTVQNKGAIPSLPRKSDVEAFLAQNGEKQSV